MKFQDNAFCQIRLAKIDQHFGGAHELRGRLRVALQNGADRQVVSGRIEWGFGFLGGPAALGFAFRGVLSGNLAAAGGCSLPAGGAAASPNGSCAESDAPSKKEAAQSVPTTNRAVPMRISNFILSPLNVVAALGCCRGDTNHDLFLRRRIHRVFAFQAAICRSTSAGAVDP